MATINLLSRLVNGVQRQVDLSSNILWVQDIQLNNSSGYTLAGTTSGHAGSSLIGDDASYTYITPTSATVKGALSGIDAALGTAAAAGANKALSNLAAVAINTSLLPGVDNSINLGSATKSWTSANIHTLVDGSSGVSVDLYNRLLEDAGGNVSIDYGNRAAKDSASAIQLSWSTSGVEFNQLTASTVPYLNASKVLTSSAVTPTQLGYLSGASGTTGTGSLAFSASPTFTGTLGAAAASFTGALNMNSNQINNLAMASTPAQTDAVNVAYVQAVLEGLSPKASVKAATIAALPSVTYSNGTAGVGATLTASANGALTVDGYAVALNDRILVKNQASALQNGIYYVSTLGTASVPFVLTRTLDADTCQPASNPSVTSGIWTFVEATSVTLGNQGWLLTTADPITLGTTALNWSQFYAQGEYVFGNGFTVSGVNIAVNLAAAGALSFSGSAIQVNVSSTGGIQISSNNLALLLQSSTALVTSASGLAWQFDNSTIGVNGSNQAYVPAAGITKTQVNTNVFDQITITGGAGSSAAVAYAPSVQFTGVAGQAFSANRVYALRFGLPQNSETAGRLYAADIATTSYDLFWVVGFLAAGAAVSIGGAITVIQEGAITLGSGDTNFGANDPGKPCYLQSGGLNATTTPPSTTGQAVAAIGMVLSTTSFRAMIRAPYVY
ncbi:unnamed protein product [Sphagnum balticum]